MARNGWAGRRRPAATAVSLAVAALALAGGSGCAADPGPHVEGPAPAVDRDSRPLYVSDAAGEPLQRPERFAVTEFTSLTGLRWESWGESSARATGRVAGTWCLPECEGGYAATVELSAPAVRERVAYYTRVTVDAEGLPPGHAAELAGLRLYAPFR
ncbi:hypothetical protein [Streptomyces lonarensis]|uniref:Lipoprotein n=1 Tax=Streptomyces lonarensis TaxID=700599 RepID=A0A7X6HYL8_9ACTN|nr:hypothetical protein [Streptomyces lonarensis]NJQ05726.1 hypothetical protein [Streptomyces lonarensis]